MPQAQLRIAVLQRDRLDDHAAARASFHRLYSDFPKSILRPKALFEEAGLAKHDGDSSTACVLANRILDEFPDSRFARRADDVCPAVTARAADLRKRKERPKD
jgi:TolA-binding protein